MVVVYGNRHAVLNAAMGKKSFIIDCANCVNPHRLLPTYSLEAFKDVYVLEVDLLYVFRDLLLETQRIMEDLGARVLCVTSWRILFHYQDAAENKNILAHCEDLLGALGQEYEVYIEDGTHRLESKAYT